MERKSTDPVDGLSRSETICVLIYTPNAPVLAGVPRRLPTVNRIRAAKQAHRPQLCDQPLPVSFLQAQVVVEAG